MPKEISQCCAQCFPWFKRADDESAQREKNIETSHDSSVMNRLYSRLVHFVFEFVYDFSVLEKNFAAGQWFIYDNTKKSVKLPLTNFKVCNYFKNFKQVWQLFSHACLSHRCKKNTAYKWHETKFLKEIFFQLAIQCTAMNKRWAKCNSEFVSDINTMD